MKSVEAIGLKIGYYNCLNEYMKICEYKRPRSLFDLRLRTLIA